MPSTTTEYQVKIRKIREYLGGVCSKCGATTNLHIDHIDHKLKRFTISSSWGRSWKILEPELRKCQLLCKTHHLEKTIEEGSLAKGWTTQPRQKHGTVWSYSKYKCRCALCKQAKSKASKQQYKDKQGLAQSG
mgnify:CR=1 FL=1